uniref:DUF1997 family protein n=1 Tax=Lupinus angustifolius TaxID=3871 RepID=L0P1A6_LUPAN|nr:hypothetical protein [Lupinus angustifolius]
MVPLFSLCNAYRTPWTMCQVRYKGGVIRWSDGEEGGLKEWSAGPCGQKTGVKVNAVTSSDLNSKKANLFAEKKERVKLPTYNDDLGGKKYHISEFLSHSSGIAAVLNTRALQSFQPLDDNTYKCALPKLQFLNFEAAPWMDLRVTSTDEDCLVEMLSCKFEGSELVEEQNNHFSALINQRMVISSDTCLFFLEQDQSLSHAYGENPHWETFMRNHMTWGGGDDAESFLEVDVKLNLTLEIYTRPFTMLPISAVERPGNLMMQALVDKLVPMLLQQMIQDYDEWVQNQLENTP